MVVTIKISNNAPEMRAAWKKYPGRMGEALLRGMSRGADIIVKEAKLRLTANKSVAFGLLRASIGQRVDKDRLRVSIGPGLSNKATGGATGDPGSYGFYVEHGRRPGRYPPARVLNLWVKRKLGVSGEGLERLEFLIARKIATEGTEPAPFLIPAVQAKKTDVQRRIQAELDAQVRKINTEST